MAIYKNKGELYSKKINKDHKFILSVSSSPKKCIENDTSKYLNMRKYVADTLKKYGDVNYYFSKFLISDSSYISDNYQKILKSKRELQYIYETEAAKHVVDELYYSILLNNETIDIMVPAYQTTTYFFLLWEVMFFYKEKYFKNMESLNIEYITGNKLTSGKSKTLISNDIIMAVTEFRKKYTHKNSYDKHNIIFVTDNLTHGDKCSQQKHCQHNFDEYELINLGINYNLDKVTFDDFEYIKNSLKKPKRDLLMCTVTHGKFGKFYDFDKQSVIYYHQSQIYFKYALRYSCYAILNLSPDGTFIIFLPSRYTCAEMYSSLVMFLEKYFKNVHIYYPECSWFDEFIIPCICNGLIDVSHDEVEQFLNKTFEVKINQISVEYKISDTTQEIIYDDGFLELNVSNNENIFETILKEPLNNFYFGQEKTYQLLDVMDKMNADTKRQFIHKRKKKQIQFATEWCKKYEMAIHPFYLKAEKNPEMLEKKLDLSTLFPKEPGINYSQLLMTDVGLYSVTPASHTIQIMNYIKKHTSGKLKDLILTESNGGMGGDTLAFSLEFKHVNTIEYSDLHCDILINNVRDVYKRKNVTFYCADYTTIFQNLEQDILYMDPPWGGPAYKFVDKLSLFIGKYRIEEIIVQLNKKTKMVVIKAPLNYNLQQLKDIVKYKKLTQYNIAKYQIIIVEVT